jgi:type IV secretion system protein VirB9
MTPARYLPLLLLLLPLFGHAETPFLSNSRDPRIKLVLYDTLSVIEIVGFYGFEQTLSFASAERIQSATIGDSLAWQVTPNAAGNKLFLKPLEPRAHTNLTVVTDRRTYNFELKAIQPGPSGASTYEIRFIYPEDLAVSGGSPTGRLPPAPAASLESHRIAAPSHPNPATWNFDYSFKGSGELAPLRVFDDGQFTYFQLRKPTPVPAIFAVEHDRHETLVNFHVSGKFIVVEQTAAQFTLRSSGEMVCVFNHAVAPVSASTR